MVLCKTPQTYAVNLNPFTAPSGNDTVLLLGNQVVNAGQEYPLQAWTSNPNGLVDGYHANDSLTTTFKASLTGTYTIGGVNPDYPDFQSAVDDLILLGICGPTTFLVRDGVYHEQIEVTEIPGADSLSQVTFKSENQDSTLVILMYDQADNVANYTLSLNGADWLNFERLTIKNTTTSYKRTIYIANGATHNTFISNRIESTGVNFSSTNNATVYIETNTNTPLELRNNLILNGSYGIYGNGAALDAGLIILNNQILDAYYIGVYLYYFDSPILEGNIIRTDGVYSSAHGVYLNYCDNQVRVVANQIQNTGGGYGLRLRYCDGSVNDTVLIANNFIYTSGLYSTYSLDTYYGSYQRIYHNNVHNASLDSLYSSAFFRVGTNPLIIQNNNFISSKGAYAGSLDNTSNIFLDYNNWYSSSEKRFIYRDSDYKSLSEWKVVSGQDVNSISVNPQFLSDSNLHVQKGLLNQSGLYLPDITTDIDGELRQNPPDIGADEFTPVGSDIAVSKFNLPSIPYAPGNYNVWFVFQNVGADTVSSLQIDWTLNGAAQAMVPWSGTLYPAGKDSVLLGNILFNNGQRIEFSAWTHSPNGNADLFPDDDSLTIGTRPALAGNYTIGGLTPDFISFNDAVRGLEEGGISDSVRFLVRPDTFYERIHLQPFIGMNCNLPVSFEAENGDSSSVWISYEPIYQENYIVWLEQVEGIRFKNLSFKNTSQFYGRIFYLTGGTECIELSGSRLEGIQNTSGSTNYSLFFSSTEQNQYLSIIGNTFLEGSQSIFIDGNSQKDSSLIVANNYLLSPSDAGIDIDDQYDLTIINNYILLDSVPSFSYGIYTNDCDGLNQIEKNQVYLPNGGRGIYVRFSNPPTGQKGFVINNFVHVRDGYGIYMNNNGAYQIAFNNVEVIGNTPYSSFYQWNSNQSDIRNNNFINLSGGYVLELSSVSNITQMDHNNLFTNGPGFAYINGSIYNDLSSWQAVSTFDGNSFSVDPGYTSNLDLHISKGLLNSAGETIAGITTDIDGETRADPPDIGADEFTPSGADATALYLDVPQAPFSSGIYNLRMAVRNSGVGAITSLTLNWVINGQTQGPFNWSGNLLPGQIDTVSLAPYNFASNTQYDIQAWVNSPNGTIDNDPADDSISVTIQAALTGIYTVGGINPDFDSLQAAVEALVIGGVVDSVRFDLRQGVYQIQIDLDSFPGMGCQIPVIFQSENQDTAQVTISYSAPYSENYVIRLNETKGVEFRHLTLLGYGPFYNRVVVLENGASCNTFSQNRIVNTTQSSTSTVYALVYDNGPNRFNLFEGNTFENGSYGYYLAGQNHVSHLMISQNYFHEQYYMGMAINNSDSIWIQNNTIATHSPYSSFLWYIFFRCRHIL